MQPVSQKLENKWLVKLPFHRLLPFESHFLSSACPRYTANLGQTKDKTDLQRAATKEKCNA